MQTRSRFDVNEGPVGILRISSTIVHAVEMPYTAVLPWRAGKRSHRSAHGSDEAQECRGVMSGGGLREDASAERSWARGRLGLPNRNLAELLGCLCKLPVKADKGCAALRLCQMESVREVHSSRHRVQSCRG